MDDPLLPRIEQSERRRRKRTLFRHRTIPVRMLVPNFFTLVLVAILLVVLALSEYLDSRRRAAGPVS